MGSEREINYQQDTKYKNRSNISIATFGKNDDDESGDEVILKIR